MEGVLRLSSGRRVTLVSLLGEKNGKSEFDFYPFGSALGSTTDSKPSFQEWLDTGAWSSPIRVVEYPTKDFTPVPDSTLQAIQPAVLSALRDGQLVVVFDSGGQQRTSQVCTHLGFVEDSTDA